MLMYKYYKYCNIYQAYKLVGSIIKAIKLFIKALLKL